MSTIALKHAALIICISLLLSLLPATRARGDDALIFNVDTTDDVKDFAINSVCSVGAATGGLCTLRAAIAEAEGNVPHTDVIINLPAGNYLLTIPPDTTNDVNSGDLNIIPPFSSSYTITLNGTGTEPSVIDANQLDRVFDLGSVHITLNNIVIRGGYLEVTEAGIIGGGIRSYANLTLNQVVIEDNTLDCGPEYCAYSSYGGGIYSGGGSLDILDSTIQRNSSPAASAIYTTSAPATLKHATVRDNYATGSGTIYNDDTLFILNSTIVGNTSEGSAGIRNYGTLSIVSSTLANSGMAANIEHSYGSVTIQDSILYAVPDLAGISYNCFLSSTELAWYSFGYNIFSDDTCPATGTGDLIDTDPLLGELGWWGGPTMTLPLLYGSPAIDHRGDVCRYMTGAPLLEDQRYFLRNDGLCDTGAFEGFQVHVFLPLITR